MLDASPLLRIIFTNDQRKEHLIMNGLHPILAQAVQSTAPTWLEPFIIGLVLGVALTFGVRAFYRRF